ncbi:hypothetical protein ABPG72_019941 [Tetrahymena utriculariae]
MVNNLQQKKYIDLSNYQIQDKFDKSSQQQEQNIFFAQGDIKNKILRGTIGLRDKLSSISIPNFQILKNIRITQKIPQSLSHGQYEEIIHKNEIQQKHKNKR